MGAPTPDVLECCEEAFLFDLAREDVWLYNYSSDSTGDTADSTGWTAMDSPAGAPGTHFSANEVAQRSRVAAVEWSTLQVLLRHAVPSCATLNNDYEMDSFIVTTLLETEPLSASEVIAARERFVGKRLSTRDLVRMVSRAGPLQPTALDNLKSVFRSLLVLEAALAAVVRAERSARHAIVAGEASACRRFLSTARHTQQLWRYERVLHFQKAAQQRVVDACTATLVTEQPAEMPAVYEMVNAPVYQRAGDALAKDEEVRVTYLEDVVGGQLRQSQADVCLIREALSAISSTLRSPTWCCEPLQRAIGDYAERLDRRVLSVESSVSALKASMSRLCRMRAGRRLRLRMTSSAPSRLQTSSFQTTRHADVFPPSFSSSSPSEAFCEMQKWTASGKPLQREKLDEPTVAELVSCLFLSMTGFSSEIASTAAKDRVQPVVCFPVFDYFAEFCDVYSASADVETRWHLFCCYAMPSDDGGGCGAASRSGHSSRAVQWFNSHEMSLGGFSSFLREWSCGADTGVHVSSDEERLRVFLLKAVLPRWVTAPVFFLSQRDSV